MTITLEYALIAGRAYQTTRGLINQFPVPQGWIEIAHVPNNPAFPQFTGTDGFEAVAFEKGSDIVISYAGTNPNSLLDPDNAANVGLAVGWDRPSSCRLLSTISKSRLLVPLLTLPSPAQVWGGDLAQL